MPHIPTPAACASGLPATAAACLPAGPHHVDACRPRIMLRACPRASCVMRLGLLPTAHCAAQRSAAHAAGLSTSVLESVARPMQLRPLSTNTRLPVTAEASGEHRKAATLPTSRAASSFWIGEFSIE